LSFPCLLFFFFFFFTLPFLLLQPWLVKCPPSPRRCHPDGSSPVFSCVRFVHAGLRSGGTSLRSQLCPHRCACRAGPNLIRTIKLQFHPVSFSLRTGDFLSPSF